MAEKEYIEREVAVEILKEKSLKKFNAYYKGYVNAISDLINMPTADVKEVRHGRWVAKIMRKENYNYGVPYEISRCSECLYMLKNNGFVGRYNYCPNCGARMDGD